MRKFYLISVILWGLLLTHQTAWAEGAKHLALNETFDTNNGKGGRDDKGFSGNVGQNNISYDQEGWIGTQATKIYGAYQCMKFGTGNDDATCTTPEMILIGTGKTATLTFNAAGWGNGTNKLTITANEGVTLSGDTEITLTNSEWKAYTVEIALNNATSLQLTFKGRRGFLDDVKVEETVTAINGPLLTDEHLFWANTTETATKHITLVPSDSTTVYYTTDGTEPTKDNGHIAMLTSNISITGTTTVKAIAYYETVASKTVSRTYTVGETVNGIEAFRSLDEGTEARIFLADDDNHEARVLYYDEKSHQLFVRDKSGAFCMDFGETATFNPTPQYNQHIAGWVVGKRTTDNGLPKLVATENTTTRYIAFAEPVTEQQTQPVAIATTAEDYDSHLADWVTAENVKVGEVFAINDLFGITTTTIDQGMLVNVSGLVIPNGTTRQIAPIAQNDIDPLVVVEGDANAILTLHSTPTTLENVYDMQGRRLNATSLRRGVYIVNGKKIIIH